MTDKEIADLAIQTLQELVYGDILTMEAAEILGKLKYLQSQLLLEKAQPVDSTIDGLDAIKTT